jgi:predicted Zn-dependent peptidase
MSSRLFQEIREKRGLCYEINSFFSPFSDSGVFAIYGGTGQRELKEFMPVLIDVMQAAAETASEEEVARARAQMKMSILTSLESPGRRTEQMARHILAYDRVLSRAELARMIDAITVEDVRAAGRKMLLTAPSVAAIGPIKALMSYDTLTTRLGTARTGLSDAPVTGV